MTSIKLLLKSFNKSLLKSLKNDKLCNLLVCISRPCKKLQKLYYKTKNKLILQLLESM